MSRGRARRYGDLTSTEVGEAVSGGVLVWPVGGLEQHGPHLPLSTDHDLAAALGEQLAVDTGGLLLPCLPFSARSLPQSGGGSGLPGTVHVRAGALVDYVQDVLLGLAGLAPAHLVVVNGHYENEALLFEALDEHAGRFGRITAFSWWSLVTPQWTAEHLPAFPGWHAEHAGVTETSLMLYLHPERVRAERPVHDRPPRAGVYRHPVGPGASNQGVLSSTTGASAELGEALFWHLAEQAAHAVR
ncbi:creatinine amidohydrolase [Crossiella equi]|uniref:Creatinine amidohydrolase n=1 Tax=Crossiella equi TaxID=130796 RepID=A0ABS5A6R8_9PSEU|nr:creatininase family protein [Crossiella equi]MBP2471909.1 creatinine amidohydrolase [Crossiella equi]